MTRKLDDIIKEDNRFRHFIELNIEPLSDWSRIKNIEIEHLSIRDSKILFEGKEILLTIKSK